MAVAFAQPTDVVKVRFQAQVRLADGGRRYNGTMDAYKTIARDEGIKGLWKGKPSSPTAYNRGIWCRSNVIMKDNCV